MSEVLHKHDLAKLIAEETGINQQAVVKVLDSFVKNVPSLCRDNKKVTLTGFGSFESRTRNARQGHNPKTLEKIDIPSKRSLHFSPAKSQVEKIND